MTKKGKASEVGEARPTEKSMGDVENLVSDVLDTPASAPKSTLPKENAEDVGLAGETAGDKTLEASPESEVDEEGGETQEGSEEAQEVESDDDVVPASKHKKTLEKMQRRIDQLTQKIKAQESEAEASAKTQEEKLANLSGTELQELRDNVDDAIIDAKVAAKTDGVDATNRVNELRALRRSIDKATTSMPQRFAAKQLKHLDAMVDTVKEIDPNIENHSGELWETAIRVYQRMPSLQRSETGQAEALAIASEYYLERKSMGMEREKASTLSQKVATLKRKTTLDGKARTANAEQVSSKKIRDKAIRGTYYDKLDFVKSLIPDDFIQPG